MGNHKAGFRYALSMFEGEGIAKNRKTAQILASKEMGPLREAANNGDQGAIHALADAYSFGLGVPQDLEKAYLLYKSSKDELESQCSLGFCYFDGLGVEQDYQECVKWWSSSANAGYPHSCCDLGTCYLSGIGMEKDAKKAIYWFEKASDSNYSPGSSFLGKCYFFGIGVEKNLAKAVQYYHLSLQQDFERGCRSLQSEGFNLRKFLDEKVLFEDHQKVIMKRSDIEVINGCIYISRNITHIETKMLEDSSIGKIVVELDNPYYKSIDGCLYNHDGSALLLYPPLRPIGDYIMPNSLEVIKDMNFFRKLVAKTKQIEV